MTIADRRRGSAASNGELWGAKARDWAEFQQGKRRLDFEECVGSTRIGQGTAVLDVGCGAGEFCRMAADAGASVTGIDAAAGMIEVARERVPNARFNVGDIQFLPYDDQSFDVVAGFHSFPFATQPLEALREARRVAKPGAPVFIVAFGREEHNELASVLRAIYALVATMPPGAPGPLALSPPGVLAALLGRAGLAVQEQRFLESAYEYPDLNTALRAIRSAGLTVLAERTAGQAIVTDAITSALSPYGTASGGYRLAAESRCIKATV
jgi:ubiquinone/menaquinone biosynthesis C-methylase UbiE